MKLLSLNLRTTRAKHAAQSWQKRYAGIAALLREHAADVLCLQEATPEGMAVLRAALPEYRMLYHGRNADRCGEGLAVAFRPSTVQPVRVLRQWLSDKPAQPGSRFSQQTGTPRIFQEVLLKQGSLRLLHTHFDHCSEAVRLAELTQLLQFAVREETPFLVLGDLNATPQSSVIAACRAFGLRDLTERLGATFHNFGVGAPKKLDYILADAKAAALPHTVTLIPTQSLSDHHAIFLQLC